MNYKIGKQVDGVVRVITTTKDMLIGDICEVDPSETGRVGHLILRTYDNFVDLNDPNATWNGQGPGLKVKALPPGTMLNIMIK